MGVSSKFNTQIAKLENEQSKSNQHLILGSYAQLTGNFEIIKNITVNSLEVRVVRQDRSDCLLGYRDHIELSGDINKDTSYSLENILRSIKRCTPKSTTNVFLNSGGGYLEDGFKMGELFNKYYVNALVYNGQTCAIAFIGASIRTIHGDGQLLFHAPYTLNTGGVINCISPGKMSNLEQYYKKYLKDGIGERLFERTMSICSSDSGWVINKGAAEIYNLI